MNVNTAINHFENLRAKKISYSMYGSRTGTDGTGDCSGVLYAALVKGGGNTEKYPPSTETLHAYLVKNGYQLHGYLSLATYLFGEKKAKVLSLVVIQVCLLMTKT